MVRVSAEVVHPEDGTHDLTNVFHFTLKTDRLAPEVIPRTYQGTVTDWQKKITIHLRLFLHFTEAMMFLDGRRHFEETNASSPTIAKL